MRPDIAVCTAGRLNSSIDWERQHKGTIRIECLNADEPAKPASLQDSIGGFDDLLAASRDLFTMWVKDIPARLRRSPLFEPIKSTSTSTGRNASVSRTGQLPCWRGFATLQNGTPLEMQEMPAAVGKAVRRGRHRLHPRRLPA